MTGRKLTTELFEIDRSPSNRHCVAATSTINCPFCNSLQKKTCITRASNSRPVKHESGIRFRHRSTVMTKPVDTCLGVKTTFGPHMHNYLRRASDPTRRDVCISKKNSISEKRNLISRLFITLHRLVLFVRRKQPHVSPHENQLLFDRNFHGIRSHFSLSFRFFPKLTDHYRTCPTTTQVGIGLYLRAADKLLGLRCFTVLTYVLTDAAA